MPTRRDTSFVIAVLTVLLSCGRFPTVVSSQNDSKLDLYQLSSDTVAAAMKFTDDAGRFTLEEPPDSTPRSNEGEVFDFIVVGAGTAGATIASRLSEIRDVTVLLIEAGGDETLFMDIPLVVNYLQMNKDINWMYETEPSDSYCRGMKNRRCKWPRGRVMGGSSVLNYMVATRGNEKDYDRWAKLGNTGWSWDKVLPYFKKLENMGIPEFRNDTVHNRDGPVYVGYPPFHTPLAEAFLQAGVELGYDEVDYNGKKNIGFSYVQTTIKNGTRLSSSRAYLHRPKRRANLFVTKMSLATRVLMSRNGKRAVGVEFLKNNVTYKVYAKKEVILSAGAIGSPQLLMLSGIGPAKHLRELGIRVRVDAPVGENLMDHVSYGGLVFLIDRPVASPLLDVFNPSLPYLREFLVEGKGPATIPGGIEAIAFVNVDDPNDPEDYPDIELVFVCASIGTSRIFVDNLGLSEEFWRKSFGALNGTYTWMISPILLRPKSRGKLLLRDSSIHSHPRLIPNYMSDPDDVRKLVKGIKAAIAVAQTKSMSNFGTRLYEAPIAGCEEFIKDSDGYWECALRSLTMNFYHYSGTCKMGATSDPTAVVNPRLQVMGVRNLRVADASIMPEIVSGHTNIPVFMIAEKLADMVKRDWGYHTDPLPQ